MQRDPAARKAPDWTVTTTPTKPFAASPRPTAAMASPSSVSASPASAASAAPPDVNSTRAPHTDTTVPQGGEATASSAAGSTVSEQAQAPSANGHSGAAAANGHSGAAAANGTALRPSEAPSRTAAHGVSRSTRDASLASNGDDGPLLDSAAAADANGDVNDSVGPARATHVPGRCIECEVCCGC